ncbi:type VII secretion system-associated protein [Streptomyces sp. AC550_RSS872]|uniref:type VII secretion system-associated protein n=1 Tax=Streptomyces sp. AC550_RSS872 TaxID=2823689 RepID=UPI001C264C8F|nr:type VII secretion system-associated protein [Streptomyces sp. AC550_RSS872]
MFHTSVLRELGDHTQADTLLHQLAQSPNPRTLSSVGESLLRQGRPEEAAQVLREALRLAGDEAPSAKTVTNLGVALLMSNRVDEAEAVLHRGAELGSPLAAANLADLLLQRDDYQGAERLWAKAVETGHLASVLNFATFLHDNGRHHEAHDRLRTEAENGELLAAALLGSFLAEETPAQDLPAARHWLTMAARSGDTDSELGLGRLLISTGDREQARRWLTRAAEKLDRQGKPDNGMGQGGTPLQGGSDYFMMRTPEPSGSSPSAQAAHLLGQLHRKDGNNEEGLRWMRLAARARVPEATLLLMNLNDEESRNDEDTMWAGLTEAEPGVAHQQDPATASDGSGPPLPDAIRKGRWYVLPEQGLALRGLSGNRDLPMDLMVGGWPLDEDGRCGPFEPNPRYVPDSAAKPTDPIHALLRLLVKGHASVDRLLALLRHTILEVAYDEQGRPRLVNAPNGALCLPVVTAALHTRRLPPARWERVLGRELPEVAPAGVDILLNPGDRAQVLLFTKGLSR